MRELSAREQPMNVQPAERPLIFRLQKREAKGAVARGGTG